MANFTPYSGFLGGVMIGLAATLLLWLNGRVAGISGILGGLFGADGPDRLWRLTFLAGLVAGPLLVAALTGRGPAIDLQAGPLTLAAMGVLVGFGTRLGGGCTSGHGVCGLARRSRRSLVATLLFFGMALATVFILRHVVAA